MPVTKQEALGYHYGSRPAKSRSRGPSLVAPNATWAWLIPPEWPILAWKLRTIHTTHSSTPRAENLVAVVSNDTAALGRYAALSGHHPPSAAGSEGAWRRSQGRWTVCHHHFPRGDAVPRSRGDTPPVTKDPWERLCLPSLGFISSAATMRFSKVQL